MLQSIMNAYNQYYTKRECIYLMRQHQRRRNVPMSTLKAPRRRVNWFKRDWRLYTMLAIPVIWYLLFCYKPMIGVIIAFQKYSLVKGMWGSRWVGLDNFEFVMGLRDFPLALQNTLLLNLMGLIMGFPVPIILAIMLNEIQHKGVKRVSQTLLYLPHFLSWIIIGGMVLKIFANTTGVNNTKHNNYCKCNNHNDGLHKV